MNCTKLIVVAVGVCLLMANAGYAQEDGAPSNEVDQLSPESEVAKRSGFPDHVVDLPSRELVVPDSLVFATRSGLGIQFGGEVELEYVNVEGKGGFSNQDQTVQKVRNRSPHIRIDKAVLEPRIYYSDYLTYQIEFRFNDRRAYVDKHFARLYAPKVNTVFELGKSRPMIYRDRQTEGYPLVGTAFWKGREYHLTSITQFSMYNYLNMVVGLSAAMKRPLGSDDAAEDKSFKMLVYDDYLTLDGQTTEFGGMLGGNAGGWLSVLGWYYHGELIDDFDWKIQLSQNFQDYDYLAEAKGEPINDLTHHWYGGRVGVDILNLHAVAEYDRSQDGHLPRHGYSGELGYSFSDLARALSVSKCIAFFRYDVLNVEDHPANLGNPQTWDREMTTAAFVMHFTKSLNMKVEYYWIDEVTGGDPEAVPPEDSVDDDQLLIQLNFKF